MAATLRVYFSIKVLHKEILSCSNVSNDEVQPVITFTNHLRVEKREDGREGRGNLKNGTMHLPPSQRGHG